MEQVNERSTAYLTVTFRDKAGATAAPSTISYQVEDVDSGVAIRAATAVAPAESVEIVLAPSDHVILGNGFRDERRCVTVEATYGADDAVRSQVVYRVVNLRAVGG
jgi:hypothetical protein